MGYSETGACIAVEEGGATSGHKGEFIRFLGIPSGGNRSSLYHLSVVRILLFLLHFWTFSKWIVLFGFPFTFSYDTWLTVCFVCPILFRSIGTHDQFNHALINKSNLLLSFS